MHGTIGYKGKAHLGLPLNALGATQRRLVALLFFLCWPVCEVVGCTVIGQRRCSHPTFALDGDR
jgi:hypothetical protein